MPRFDDVYPAYVSVAERRKRAAAELAKHKKAGDPWEPVAPIEGRVIATTFWGKGWCERFESFRDFESRLPRGRSYVRNGSVIDLRVTAGAVRARVMGSDPTPYEITVTVKPLAGARWKTLAAATAGKISSLVGLLSGELSPDVLEVLTKRDGGLYPEPGELEFDCSCPDWAKLCKHVAASLYGIGARLDARPELLFTLRGVDETELVSSAARATLGARKATAGKKLLDDKKLGSIFGIELAPPGTRRKKR